MKFAKAKGYCIAFGCFNTDKDPNLTFFTLPTENKRRQKWLKLIDRQDLLQHENIVWRSHRICSAHFEDVSIKLVRYLKKNAVPTINLPKPNQAQESPSSSSLNSTSAHDKEKTSRKKDKEKTREKSPTLASNSIKQECCSEEEISPQIEGKNNSNEPVIKCFSVETQTESVKDQTQTKNSFIADTPRKRRLSKEIKFEIDIKKEL